MTIAIIPLRCQTAPRALLYFCHRAKHMSSGSAFEAWLYFNGPAVSLCRAGVCHEVADEPLQRGTIPKLIPETEGWRRGITGTR